MRVAQIFTASNSVHESGFPRAERMIRTIASELTRRGHEVTTFGAEEFQINDCHVAEWATLCDAVKQSRGFDLLHCHGHLFGLPLESLSDAPMVHTMYAMPQEGTARLWRRYPNARVVALTHKQYHAFPDLRPIAVIPPGVDATKFCFQSNPADCICCLSDFEAGDGTLQAIDAARAIGIRLIIAGSENSYYRNHIKPLIDGSSIEFVRVGEIAEPDDFFRNAKALIYPDHSAEAFDLTLVEAMLHGTPIVAVNCEMASEIIEQDITGCYTDNAAELPALIKKACDLDRRSVRAYAEKKFSFERMVSQYELVYKAVCGIGGLA